LSAVVRLKESFGIGYTIDFLRGSKSEKIWEAHKQIKTYGVGADISKDDWGVYFRDLIAKGYLQQTDDEFPKLRLTAKSEDILKGLVNVQLVKTRVLEEARGAPLTSAEAAYEKELFNDLKDLRNVIADKEHTPAYIIMSDAALIEMAAYLPHDLTELRKISGFGDIKLRRYGQEFLDCILAYCKRKNLPSRIQLKQPKRERVGSSLRKARHDETGTYQATLDLYRQGLSIAEIAVRRNKAPQTISGHLARFIELGDLKAEQFVTKDKINHIKSLVDKHGSLSLKLLKENAADDITYDDIKFVLSDIRAGSSSF
jgi:ATP-dependent DNA helicase RecQ